MSCAKKCAAHFFCQNTIEINLFGAILINRKQIASFRKERRMRHKSIDLMNSIQEFIENYYMQNHQSTSTTEIAEEVGIAR